MTKRTWSGWSRIKGEQISSCVFLFFITVTKQLLFTLIVYWFHLMVLPQVVGSSVASKLWDPSNSQPILFHTGLGPWSWALCSNHLPKSVYSNRSVLRARISNHLGNFAYLIATLKDKKRKLALTLAVNLPKCSIKNILISTFPNVLNQ